MPNTLGTTTKTTFFKGVESHKLHEEFDVEGLTQTLTLSGALVAANVINGSVGGNAIAPVTYAASSDATLQAIATAIAALDGVKSAVVTVVGGDQTGTDDVEIVVTPEDQVAGIALTGWVVTLGAGQATIAVATVNKKVKKGMPVEINALSGKIQPVTVATHDLTCVGIAVHDAVEGELCTVALRGYTIIYARSASAMTFGAPVKFDSYDSVNSYNKVEDGSVTVANQMGWAIDEATAADETIRVIVKA